MNTNSDILKSAASKPICDNWLPEEFLTLHKTTVLSVVKSLARNNLEQVDIPEEIRALLQQRYDFIAASTSAPDAAITLDRLHGWGVVESISGKQLIVKLKLDEREKNLATLQYMLDAALLAQDTFICFANMAQNEAGIVLNLLTPTEGCDEGSFTTSPGIAKVMILLYVLHRLGIHKGWHSLPITDVSELSDATEGAINRYFGVIPEAVTLVEAEPACVARNTQYQHAALEETSGVSSHVPEAVSHDSMLTLFSRIKDIVSTFDGELNINITPTLLGTILYSDVISHSEAIDDLRNGKIKITDLCAFAEAVNVPELTTGDAMLIIGDIISGYSAAGENRAASKSDVSSSRAFGVDLSIAARVLE